MSFKKEVKKYVNELQADYMCNLQNYPRIENDYIQSKTHSLYPHIPFKRISPSYNVFKKTKLKLEKKSSLLYLSKKRLISPSQAVSYAETIDNFFDEKLLFKLEIKRQELLLLKELMHKFLEEEINIKNFEEQKEFIIKKYNDIYDNAKKDFQIRFYTNKSVNFFHFSTFSSTKEKIEPKIAFENFFYKKMKQNEKAKREEYLLHKERLIDCINDFKINTQSNNRSIKINDKINNFLLKYE